MVMVRSSDFFFLNTTVYTKILSNYIESRNRGIVLYVTCPLYFNFKTSNKQNISGKT